MHYEDLKRTKICITLPSVFPLGGTERVRIMIAKQFCERGYDVDFVVGYDENLDQLNLPKTIKIFHLSAKKTKQAIVPFARYLRKHKPDIVLSALWPFNTICLIAAFISGTRTPIAVSEHNTLTEQYRGWGFFHKSVLRLSLAIGHRLAHARIAVSKGVADDLAELAGLRRSSITVINNPMNPELDLTPASQAVAVWPEDRTISRIVTAGRLKKQKNHSMLLNAFARLLQSRQCHLAILGTGELEDHLRDEVSSLKLQDNVTLAGHVDNPAGWFSTSDLFVLSSDYEGFPNVLIEALAAGLAVVSTDCRSGPDDILDGGQFGFLTPIGDSDAFCAAMESALSSPANPHDQKRRASVFSLDHVTNSYLDALFPG